MRTIDNVFDRYLAYVLLSDAIDDLVQALMDIVRDNLMMIFNRMEKIIR